MKPITLLLIGAVTAANLALNVLLLRTAERATSFGEAVFSRQFAAAFAVGTITALLMLWMYLTRIELARAILLLGALSILGGTLFGVGFYKTRLDPVEWSLFGLIALLYGYRIYLAIAKTL